MENKLYNELILLGGKIEKQKKICKFAESRPDRMNPYHENNKLKEMQVKYNKIIEDMNKLNK